jgi:ADP-ribose pyrophosphatase YjhB (NUDIX family)
MSEVRYPLTCVGALVRSPSGRVLIVKTTKWTDHWGVPGGKIDWGETKEEALRREFREEVGSELFNIRFAQVQDAVESPEFYKPAHFVLIDFFADSGSEAITPNEEIVEWAWVEPAKALDYPLNTFSKTLVNLYLRRGEAMPHPRQMEDL